MARYRWHSASTLIRIPALYAGPGSVPLLVLSYVYGGARPHLDGYTLHLLDAVGIVAELGLNLYRVDLS